MHADTHFTVTNGAEFPQDMEFTSFTLDAETSEEMLGKLIAEAAFILAVYDADSDINIEDRASQLINKYKQNEQ